MVIIFGMYAADEAEHCLRMKHCRVLMSGTLDENDYLDRPNRQLEEVEKHISG